MVSDAAARGDMINRYERTGLSLTLLLREPHADQHAAAFVAGVGWPPGTCVRLIRRPGGLLTRRGGNPHEGLLARLKHVGIAVVDDPDDSQPPGSNRTDLTTDLVITGACGSSGHLRSVIVDVLASARAPLLVASRPMLERGLVVLDHELAPALADLLVREPFCRARLRVLGVVDVTVPWYAGIGFSPAELLEAVTIAVDEAHEQLDAATRRAALRLSWSGIPASAEVREGNAQRLIVGIVGDMAADWVVLARAIHGNRAMLHLVDKLVRQAGCSVLLAPPAPD
jgi:hypothetical protein